MGTDDKQSTTGEPEQMARRSTIGEIDMSPSERADGGTVTEGMWKSIGYAAALMLLTVLGMLVVSMIEPLANLTLLAFSVPLIGALIFGGLITAGRHVGMHGAQAGNATKAGLGSALCIVAYSAFGGAILSMYSAALYIPALAITAAITIVITLAIAVYVFRTNKDLSKWGSYSTYCFFGGIGALVVGYILPPVYLLAFVLILAGFLCDLVYEIWHVSRETRTPFSNGIAVYVAFAGVFVHILQLVLRALARE